MKNLNLPILLLVLLVPFLSCNKTNSPNLPPALQDSLPKVFSVYQPLNHSKIVEMFVYNKQAKLASIQAYSFDSSSGSPVIDSFLVSFTLTAAVQPSSSYDETFHLQGDPPAGNAEHHILAYDAQNRVTIDSITATTTNSFSSQHYQYDIYGNTTIEWLFGDPQTPGSYKLSQIDTIFVQNEVVGTDINYSEPGETLNHFYSRTYSTHVNPLYNNALANSLGCLMVFNNFMDFRSKYLPTHFTGQENGSPTVTINYLWTTDATGSVVKGTGTDATDGTVKQIYTYIY